MTRPMPIEERWFRVVAWNGPVCLETTDWLMLSEANELAETYVGLAAPVVIELTEDGGLTTEVHRVVVGDPRDVCADCGGERANHGGTVGCARFVEPARGG